MVTLPPVPPPPRPPVDYSKILWSLLGLIGIVIVASFILNAITRSMRHAQIESQKNSAISSLRAHLGGGRFYDCFEASQSLPSNIRDETWSIRSECIQAEIRRIQDKQGGLDPGGLAEAWSRIESIIQNSYSDHLNLGAAQNARGELANLMESVAKKDFEEGRLETATKLLDLIGRTDLSSEYKKMWSSDKKKYENLSSTKPDESGTESSLLSWPKMESSYWEQRLLDFRRDFDINASSVRQRRYQSILEEAEELFKTQDFEGCLKALTIIYQRQYGGVNDDIFRRQSELMQPCLDGHNKREI
jgi:hypothetical protein